MTYYFLHCMGCSRYRGKLSIVKSLGSPHIGLSEISYGIPMYSFQYSRCPRLQPYAMCIYECLGMSYRTGCGSAEHQSDDADHCKYWIAVELAFCVYKEVTTLIFKLSFALIRSVCGNMQGIA